MPSGRWPRWSLRASPSAYHADSNVLQDVCLKIGKGETIAIVGPNGCGKSTLAKLIPRFYDPTSGSIRWNGVDIRDVRRRDLRNRIGLVTQRTLLFNDTVFNNILYGSPQASRADVIEAAQRAYAHDFIVNELADGYEALVGQGGTTSPAASASGSRWLERCCAIRNS